MATSAEGTSRTDEANLVYNSSIWVEGTPNFCAVALEMVTRVAETASKPFLFCQGQLLTTLSLGMSKLATLAASRQRRAAEMPVIATVTKLAY